MNSIKKYKIPYLSDIQQIDIILVMFFGKVNSTFLFLFYHNLFVANLTSFYFLEYSRTGHKISRILVWGYKLGQTCNLLLVCQ